MTKLTEGAVIKEEHIKQASDGCEALGPAYFAADALCQKFFEKWEPENLDAIAVEVSATISKKLHSDLHDFIWDGQLEASLQNTAYTMVDDTVKALLIGEGWALKRYVFNNKYNDGRVVREAIAKLIPEEVKGKRISDLEADLASAQEEIAQLQRRVRTY